MNRVPVTFKGEEIGTGLLVAGGTKLMDLQFHPQTPKHIREQFSSPLIISLGEPKPAPEPEPKPAPKARARRSKKSA